jgi:hypothetical protein
MATCLLEVYNLEHLLNDKAMLKNRVFKIAVFIGMLFCVSPVVGQNYEFKSYHLYSNDEDKYSPTNVQNADAKVCINEVNQEIELSLYIPNEGKWKNFSMVINYKIDLGVKSKFGTLYMCANNIGQSCGVCVCNTKEGLFIDLHNFMMGETPLSCWVKTEK